MSSTATSGLRVQSEYSVCTAAIGCTAWALRMVAADTSHRPMVFSLACFDQPRQLADALLDRQALVPAVQVVEVDDIGAQVAEAVLEVAADDLGPAVDHPLAVEAEHAALGRQQVVAAAPLEHLAEQPLVGAEAVERRGVQVGVAEVERREQDGRRLLGRWRRAVGMRQAHAPESDDSGLHLNGVGSHFSRTLRGPGSVLKK